MKGRIDQDALSADTNCDLPNFSSWTKSLSNSPLGVKAMSRYSALQSTPPSTFTSTSRVQKRPAHTLTGGGPQRNSMLVVGTDGQGVIARSAVVLNEDRPSNASVCAAYASLYRFHMQMSTATCALSGIRHAPHDLRVCLTHDLRRNLLALRRGDR